MKDSRLRRPPRLVEYLARLDAALPRNLPRRDEICLEIELHIEEAVNDAQMVGADATHALEAALADMGDAEVLASRFRSVRPHRRWIMHTALSAASVALLMLASIDSPWAVPIGVPGESAAVAQASGNPIETALEQRAPEVSFNEAPLELVIDWLAQVSSTNVVIDRAGLDSAGVAMDTLISLSVRNVTLRTVLDLVCRQLSDPIGYVIADEYLLISSLDRLATDAQTRVYEVRDVIEILREGWMVGLDEHGQAVFTELDPPSRVQPDPQATPEPAVAPPSLMELAARTPAPGEQRLISLLVRVVEPDSWSVHGGFGEAQVVNGILVVRQGESGHREIRKLLSDLKSLAAARNDSEAATPSPFAGRGQ